MIIKDALKFITNKEVKKNKEIVVSLTIPIVEKNIS